MTRILKVVLCNLRDNSSPQQQQQQHIPATGTTPALTLSYASSALRTCSHLIRVREMATASPKPFSRASASSPHPTTAKLALLKAAALLKQAYVALRMESHSEALRYVCQKFPLSLCS